MRSSIQAPALASRTAQSPSSDGGYLFIAGLFRKRGDEALCLPHTGPRRRARLARLTANREERHACIPLSQLGAQRSYSLRWPRTCWPGLARQDFNINLIQQGCTKQSESRSRCSLEDRQAYHITYLSASSSCLGQGDHDGRGLC